MRFRLSSFLLMIALVALVTAWYVDHHRHRSDDIVGVWYYPTSDHPFCNGQQTLTIRADGTFTLEEKAFATYSGTCKLAGNGIALFHVTSKRQLFGGMPPQTYEVDKTYRCRIARDSYSNLIVIDLEPDVGSLDSGAGSLDPDMDSLHLDMRLLGDVRVEFSNDVFIDWRCYTSRRREQGEAREKLLKSWVDGMEEGREGD